MSAQWVMQYSTAGTNLLSLILCAACLKTVSPPALFCFPTVHGGATAKLSVASLLPVQNPVMRLIVYQVS